MTEQPTETKTAVVKTIDQKGWTEKQIAAYEKIEDPKKKLTYGLMVMGKARTKENPLTDEQKAAKLQLKADKAVKGVTTNKSKEYIKQIAQETVKNALLEYINKGTPAQVKK